MMSGDADHSIKRILATTDNMLQACRNDDWDTLSALHQDRQEIIEELFSDTGHLSSYLDSLKSMIERVREIDDAIMGICRTQSDECKDMIRANNSRRKGIASYISCHSGC